MAKLIIEVILLVTIGSLCFTFLHGDTISIGVSGNGNQVIGKLGRSKRNVVIDSITGEGNTVIGNLNSNGNSVVFGNTNGQTATRHSANRNSGNQNSESKSRQEFRNSGDRQTVFSESSGHVLCTGDVFRALRVNPSGTKNERLEYLNDTSQLDISAPLDVTLMVNMNTTEQSSIEFTGDANFLPYIQISEDNGVLRVTMQDDICFQCATVGACKVTAILNVQDLSSVKLSGAASLQTPSILSVNSLVASVSGASSMTMLVDVEEKLNLDVSGSAHVSINGSAKSFQGSLKGASKLELSLDTRSQMRNLDTQNLMTLDVAGASHALIKSSATSVSFRSSGASEIQALDSAFESVIAEAKGASQMYLAPTESLSAKVSGASAVYYQGSPQVTQDVSGAGYVQQID